LALHHFASENKSCIDMPVLPSSFFEYPLTRAFTLKYFTHFMIAFGLAYTAIITIFAAIAVGYENEVLLSGRFNESLPMWYDSLPPYGSVNWVFNTFQRGFD
jgi:hypothetical protein